MIARLLAVVSVSCLLATALIASEPTKTPTERSLTAIRTDVSDALRAEATTRKNGDNTSQIMRLVDLYLEMAADPRRDTSPLLADLGQQVRLRLQTVRERVERRIADKKPGSKKNAKPASIEAKAENRVLAQQVPQAGAGNQQGAVGQGAGAAAAPRVAARPTDFGPELVELIEAVVSPATWKINGGNGAIVYYSPLHVLVVSAPDEVHAQVGGALRQLQAAQRQQDGVHVVGDVGAVQDGQ